MGGLVNWGTRPSLITGCPCDKDHINLSHITRLGIDSRDYGMIKYDPKTRGGICL